MPTIQNGKVTYAAGEPLPPVGSDAYNQATAGVIPGSQNNGSTGGIAPVNNGTGGGTGGAPVVTTPKPNVGDPNSIVDFLSSQGQANDIESRAKLYASTFGASGGTYTGSAAQNMALLTKLKGGYSYPTNNNSISGSGSVAQNQNVDSALGAAGSSMVPDSGTADTAKASPTDLGTDNATSPIQSTIDKLNQDAQDQIDALTVPFTQQLKSLQEQQRQAMAAASQEYVRAGGIVSSTGEQQYVGNVQQHYQDQMDELQANFNIQKQQILSSQVDAVQKAQTDYVSTNQSNFKDYLAGLKEGDGTQPDSDEILDAVQTAVNGGFTATQAIAQIKGALAYASRTQKHSDLQDQAIIASLSSKTSAEKVLSPTEISNLKDQYPELKDQLNYGITGSQAANIISNRPTVELKTGIFSTNAATKAGLNDDNIKEIQDWFSKGYSVDDVIAANPDMTADQKEWLKNYTKSI